MIETVNDGNLIWQWGFRPRQLGICPRHMYVSPLLPGTEGHPHSTAAGCVLRIVTVHDQAIRGIKFEGTQLDSDSKLGGETTRGSRFDGNGLRRSLLCTTGYGDPFRCFFYPFELTNRDDNFDVLDR